MSEVRSQIRRRVIADPGIHFNELVRELDLAAGQTQYHVRRLARAGDLVDEQLYGRTHYYPPSFDVWDRRTLALMRRETCREVVYSLSKHGPASPGDIAVDLDIARSTLEWHLDNLVEQNLVEKRYDDRGRVEVWLLEPERTAELLSNVTPTVSDRLVDRFIRLVDQLGTDVDRSVR